MDGSAEHYFIDNGSTVHEAAVMAFNKNIEMGP